MKSLFVAIFAGAWVAALGIGSVARSQSVLTYHAAIDWSCRYIIPEYGALPR